MDIAILIYDKLAILDAAGPYEVMRNVPGWQVRFVAKQPGEVRCEGGLGLIADASLEQAGNPDLVLVPGGIGSRTAMHDEETLEWLRAVDRQTKWTTSVCTGSLILGAAGLLEGRRATAHWLARDALAGFGAIPTAERVVRDGNLITAGGVTAGIDFGLTVVAELAGREAAETIQLHLEYAPAPPFDAGTPETAPASIVAAVRERLAGSREAREAIIAAVARTPAAA
jgi:cyclohexyl-isocyanide hydratase